jgi:type I restriction enzyme R subunit
MNEAETRAELIDPALAAAGWGVVEGSKILREYPITPGRIEGHGRRGKPLTADYVLVYRNRKLAVVEAKALDEELTEGVGQAKNYAGKLAVRFAYSTNGQGIYQVDMSPAPQPSTRNPQPAEGEVPSYPAPDQLWNRTFAQANAWRDRFSAVPFEDKGGSHPIPMARRCQRSSSLNCSLASCPSSSRTRRSSGPSGAPRTHAQSC